MTNTLKLSAEEAPLEPQKEAPEAQAPTDLPNPAFTATVAARWDGALHAPNPTTQSNSGCRQQLSCDSKEILEHAAHAELSRLRSLRSELGNLQAGATAFVHLDARLDALELALRQLGYAYIDQFEEGRAENDRAGRLGLTR
jgi:hypothetical protein